MIMTIETYKKKFLGKICFRKKAFPSVKAQGPLKPIDRAARIAEAEYVVLDTELTGLNNKMDSIVSIGAVKMVGGRIDLGSIYSRLVEPRTELTGKSIVIHGITPSEAAECPSIDTLLPEFLDFCGSGIIVGHFVSMDLGFLNKDMKRLYGAVIKNQAVDTGRIYGWLRKKEGDSCAYNGDTAEDLNLFKIAESYGIQTKGAHNALNDAFITAQVLQRFISVLPKYGISTVGELLRIGKP